MPDKDTPKDDTKDEKKPEDVDTPPPPPPPVAAPVPAKAHHDVGETIDRMSHVAESQMGIFEGLFTKPMVIVGVLLGITMQFLGAIMLNYGGDAFKGVIFNLGSFLMTISLVGGALTNERIDPYVRFGMLFLAAFVGFNLIPY